MSVPLLLVFLAVVFGLACITLRLRSAGKGHESQGNQMSLNHPTVRKRVRLEVREELDPAILESRWPRKIRLILKRELEIIRRSGQLIP